VSTGGRRDRPSIHAFSPAVSSATIDRPDDLASRGARCATPYFAAIASAWQRPSGQPPLGKGARLCQGLCSPARQRKPIVTVNRRHLRTFDNQSGRNVFYRAAIHPMTADLTAELVDRVARADSVAVYDPAGYFADLAAMYDVSRWPVEGVYVQRIEEIGRDRGGFPARPLTRLADSNATMVFVADFDGERLLSRLGPYRPAAGRVEGFDSLKLGREWLTNPERYLDPLNFVSDFLFFRDAEGLHTTVSTINYWHNHGAAETRLWCRLLDADGAALASWEQNLSGPCGIVLDSGQIRRRFGLGEFTGSLFVHVIGAAAHDTLKYAVDIYDDSGATATATHDSNPWAAELYAGLPAPDAGQKVRLWVQNCYGAPIPAGAIAMRPMGGTSFKPVGREIPPYGTAAIDIGEAFPDVAWPGQLEVRANKYFCRPRYEIVMADGHRSTAHPNVERTDLKPAADLPEATGILGKGFILPGPLLPVENWTSIVLPTPMASWQDGVALILRAYDSDGALVVEQPLGKRARGDSAAIEIDRLLDGRAALAGGYGHLELSYDFATGTEADGWIHALFRYALRATGRSAETSFGSHLFNVPAVWRNEPNSYLGKPPGLSTRLYLRLTDRPGRVMCQLIYPTSGRWRPFSETDIVLHTAEGVEVARRRVEIPCSGSRLLDMAALFDETLLARAAGGGYAMIRDTTCRLFGYHLFVGDGGGFALDHMFGF